ncbi:MFS transporter [Saccharothrix sp. NPDC042600]|uniref:MFS transporter n=1 Tax=Saccharothrix TaxID=2071 RepID=UPI0033FD1D97|nr:MFS transporter [Saccharothrix mutabilis subsp. capreolus]
MRDFRLFWGSDTVSQFGSAVSVFALPLVAVEMGVSEFAIGLLTAAGMAAFLLVGLPVGVFVDRVRRRPVQVWGNAGRAAALASVPLVGWFGGLSFEYLLAVALLVGVLSVFVEVAALSYLTALVPRAELSAANSRMMATQQVARLSGKPLAGVFAEVFGAVGSLFAVTASFAVSGALLGRVRTPEPVPEPARRRVWADMGEGLRFVFGHALLRPLVLCTTTFNLANGVWSALNVVFLVRVLDLPAGVAALLLGVGSAGGAVAGLFVGRLSGRRLVWSSLVCTQPAWLVVPWAEHGWVVAAGCFVATMGVLVYNVAQVSLRQALCPDRLMGRMNASIRFLAWGAMPVGALLGGALAEWVGVRGGLWVASVGMVLAVGWVLASPLRASEGVPPRLV